VSEVEQVLSPNLADKEIWIIDDSIPLEQARFAHRDMLEGSRPIDRGSLVALLDQQWGDSNVKALCIQLIQEAKTVTAFIQPAAAVEYLESGVSIPDAIVFDMRYQTTPDSSLPYLERILKGCVATVQVYTNESKAEAVRDLAPLSQRYQTRLAPPEIKGETTATVLATAISKRLQSSLSANLAKNIRTLSMFAVENVLTRLDALPLSKAFELLAKDTKTAEELEIELVELLSEKIGEHLKTSAELTNAFGKYAKSKGIPDESSSQAVQEMVSILAAQVRERILYDQALHEVVSSTRKAIDQSIGQNQQQSEVLQSTIKDFFAFRLYSQPGDRIVRTGDIVAFGKDNEDSPELFLIITPPCDLDKFWKKTRGILTVAKMYPSNGIGLTKSRKYGNNNYLPGDSITARHPMVLPSIPVSKENRLDYVLFAHEIQTIILENNELANVGNNNQQVQRPLMYSDLSNDADRKCRISEPFLSGILSELSGLLFRSGIPDFPKEEHDRLKGVFNAQQ
jgi:hypothetical protein